MRVAPAHRQLGDRHAVRHDRALREQPELLRDRAGRQLVDGLAVQQHRALLRGHQAGQRAQQGRLAAAVRADDRRDGPLGDVEVEAIDDDAVGVGERDVVGGQLGHDVLAGQERAFDR